MKLTRFVPEAEPEQYTRPEYAPLFEAFELSLKDGTWQGVAGFDSRDEVSKATAHLRQWQYKAHPKHLMKTRIREHKDTWSVILKVVDRP